MKQWDIYTFPYPSEEESHPGVILSPDAVATNDAVETVNVLLCATVRPETREPKFYEVYLDQEDGLERKTAVKSCLKTPFTFSISFMRLACGELVEPTFSRTPFQ